MSYLIKAVELSTKNQVEIERKDYLSKPLEEQRSIGVKLLTEDLNKTNGLDLAGKIMRSQQTQIQAHQSKLGQPFTNAKLMLMLHVINLKRFMIKQQMPYYDKQNY